MLSYPSDDPFSLVKILLEESNMIPVYLIFFIWLVVFFIHFKRARSRNWTGKILICLPILSCMFSILMFAHGVVSSIDLYSFLGSSDTDLYFLDIFYHCKVLILNTGISIFTLILSAGAWLISSPKPFS